MHCFQFKFRRTAGALLLALPLALAACENSAPREQPAPASVQVTLADAEAIQAALLARLRQQTELAERDELIAATQHVTPSIDGDIVRMGLWILDVRDRKGTLTYRLPPQPGASFMPIWRADVAKTGATWVVQDVRVGHAHAR
jgi:hypothetical protein